MYVPGAWLKTGTNEIIILDLFGPDKPAIAELYLLHANNKPLSHEVWTIAYVDSEERTRRRQHGEWKDAQPNHPHRLILNLGNTQRISGIRYVPQQGNGGGRIKDYRVLVGDLASPN